MTELVRRVYLLVLVCSCARSTPTSAPSPGGSDLTLDVTPSVSGSRGATLRSGDKVASGDGIRVAVKPSLDVRVYVAYCDRNRQLAIFPKDSGIDAKAGVITYVPASDASIILDEQVGREVLYVIASRRSLDVADPELAAAISRAKPDASVECGESLDRVLDKGKSTARPAPVPVARAAATPLHSAAPPRTPPPAELQRGAFIRWGAVGAVSAGAD